MKITKTKSLLALCLSTFLAGCGSSDSETSVDTDPVAAIDVSRGGYLCFDMITPEGTVNLALDNRLAPISTQNFREYAAAGTYDNVIFHRVISNFVVQTGGFDPQFNEVLTNEPIENESDNGLKNYRGRLAMARTSNPNSATSQFYINTVNNAFLNKDQASDGVGYAVFGGVIGNMAAIDAISAVETGSVAGMSDVPVENVIIESIREVSCPTS